MIYCQLRSRASLDCSAPLRLSDVARLDAPEALRSLLLPCPGEPGVWKLEAVRVAQSIRQACPDESVSMLGADVCCVHRRRVRRRDPWKPLRTTAALLILTMGSALGLSWFHSDVDMPRAQAAVYAALTGREVQDMRWIALPYCLGVTLGVGVFYALPSRRTPTPLDVKLAEYRRTMEQAEGRDID